MYYILRQLKRFITNYVTLWSYYKLRWKILRSTAGITNFCVFTNYVGTISTTSTKHCGKDVYDIVKQHVSAISEHKKKKKSQINNTVSTSRKSGWKNTKKKIGFALT